MTLIIRSESTREISKITIRKINIKNKSKPMRRGISQNGKKEYKLPEKSIPRHLLKFIYKIENQKLTKSLNGSLSQFMANLKPNITGRISSNRSLKEMRDKILRKDWERLMPVMQRKSRKLKLPIFSKPIMK